MHISLPEEALLALELLERAGHEAWLVGGSVRDACLGRPLGDLDLATSARPDEMERVFSGHRTYATGLKHGTLTVRIKRVTMEVTTYRVDGEYTDRRHPDQVRFVRDIREDLARRDFTCNAMAWHPNRGLLDPYGGQADCESRLLRAVGEAGKRFEEDALRVLRALRFACQLGFGIEDNTWRAMMDKGAGLKSVSAERVATELNRALVSEHTAWALGKYPRALLLALPELEEVCADPTAWARTLNTLQRAPRDLPIRWAALFARSAGEDARQAAFDWRDPGKMPLRPAAALLDVCLKRLKQPGALREQAVQLAQFVHSELNMGNLRLWLSALGYEAVTRLLRLQLAGLEGGGNADDETTRLQGLLEETERLKALNVPLHIRDLAVDGQDLMALGYPEGRELGLALEQLLEEVLTGRTENERAALLQLAGRMLEGNR